VRRRCHAAASSVSRRRIQPECAASRYALLNLHTSYKFGEHVELFTRVDNLLNARYATFGQFGDPTGVGAPGIPSGATTNSPGVDNRFQSPGAPIAAFGGIRATF
jgi:iron complex outermembrane receptor protein